MRTCVLISLVLRMGSDVRLPADRSAGHCSDDSGLQPTEVALPAFPLANDPGRLEQARDGPQLSVVRAASCLEQCLDNVQGRGKRRSKTTSQTTSEAVRVGVVATGGVHDLRYRFVRHELQRGEGHSHAQCGGVRDVERANALLAEDVPGAVADGRVDGTVQLHALLDDWDVLSGCGRDESSTTNHQMGSSAHRWQWWLRLHWQLGRVSDGS